MSDFKFRIVDVIAEARDLGFTDEQLHAINPERNLKKLDYRWQVTTITGSCVTFGVGATASEVMAYIKENWPNATITWD